ncbi:MAG: hypothetical protein KME43_11320 [Myxacorys chilensis ATA2-1-KO14]|jgi:hypothetical protein|nr:hypothetical protein [Myxacorys chilensis ATA2-1-KO14]
MTHLDLEPKSSRMELDLDYQTNYDRHRALQAQHRWTRRLTSLTGLTGTIALIRLILWLIVVPLPYPMSTETSGARPPAQTQSRDF